MCESSSNSNTSCSKSCSKCAETSEPQLDPQRDIEFIPQPSSHGRTLVPCDTNGNASSEARAIEYFEAVRRADLVEKRLTVGVQKPFLAYFSRRFRVFQTWVRYLGNFGLFHSSFSSFSDLNTIFRWVFQGFSIFLGHFWSILVVVFEFFGLEYDIFWVFYWFVVFLVIFWVFGQFFEFLANFLKKKSCFRVSSVWFWLSPLCGYMRYIGEILSKIGLF